VVVVKLSIENFSVDNQTPLPHNQWYTYAGFDVAQTRKILGVFPKKTIFTGNHLIFLVCSDGVKDMPKSDDIDLESFDKRFTLPKLDESLVRKYVDERIVKASGYSDISAAFGYLEKYFNIDE